MGLMTVDELARRLDGDGVRVVDVRFQLADHDQGRRSYDASHIPGAVFVDLHTELAGGPGGGRHPLPSVGEFRALLGRIGVGPATTVVAYDDLGGAIAARLWWMLRSIGHADVAVLDGGYPAWSAGGFPTTAAVPDVSPTSYPDTGDWTGIVDADEVAVAAERRATVVDARAPDRYRGDHEPIDPKAGHIPGAVNRFHGDLLGDGGRHRSVEELSSALAGIDDDPIVYCGSGVTACHLLLGLSEVGVTGARLYPGSWSDWSSDPARPVATGT